MDALANHPQAQARSVFEPVITGRVQASHAYLLHGPPGSGRSEVAELVATALLSEGSERTDNADRVKNRTHPDLTWITPEGANGEVLVDDVRDKIIAAVPMTPFESRHRVFVIEGADRMNDSSANAFLKTLEEPPHYAHLFLIADSLDSVMPTIVSRCQSVRFSPPTPAALAEMLVRNGVEPDLANECSLLADGNGERALTLASPHGIAIRDAGEAMAGSALKGSASTAKAWVALLAAATDRGKTAAAEIEAASATRLEIAAKSERSKLSKEAEDRGKRARRRAEGKAVDLALFIAERWLRDLQRVAVGASDLVADSNRRAQLEQHSMAARPMQIRSAIDMVARARRAMSLNATRELALEALAHQLDGALK